MLGKQNVYRFQVYTSNYKLMNYNDTICDMVEWFVEISKVNRTLFSVKYLLTRLQSFLVCCFTSISFMHNNALQMEQFTYQIALYL